jgi:hypothetical protein
VILLPVLFYFNPVEKMKLSVIQPDTAWEDKNKNFRIIWELSSGLENDTDIIILTVLSAAAIL